MACIGYPRFQNDEKPITVSPWTGPNKFNTFSMSYTDIKEAEPLFREIKDDCRTSSGWTDRECWIKGTRWSIIYLVNGIILLFLPPVAICTLCGLREPVCRCAAAWGLIVVSLANFFNLISTAIFRFNARGKLCAMATYPTYFTDEEFDDSWTYEKDGQLILALWIL